MAISLQGFQPTQAPTSINPARGVRSQIKQDVQSLSTALQSGDLASAQKSYGDLQKLLQGNGSIGQAATGTTPPAAVSTSAGPLLSSPLDAVRSDFQALGQALQSGDLAGAKQDYAQLATDSQQIVAASRQGGGTGRPDGQHHQHRADNDGDQGGSVAGATTPSTTSTTPASRSISTTASTTQFNYSAALSSSGPASVTNANAATDPTSTDPFGTIKNDFQSIGKDLQSGSLDEVQKDYAQLLKDAQKLFDAPAGTDPQAPSATAPAPGSGAAAAYQFQLSASFQSASATTAADGSQTANYQASSIQESASFTQAATSASQGSAYQFSFQASYQSQSVSYVG